MKLDDVRIKSIIAEEIRRFLREESSISDIVKDTAKSITNILVRGEYEFTHPFYDIGEFTVVGVPIEVNAADYRANGKTEPNERKITVEIPMLNGTVLKNSVYKVVSHEVEHLFQITKRDSASWGKYSDIYNKAMDLGNSDDYYISNLSKYIYSCTSFEQDAFVNELYAELMSIPFFSQRYVVDAVQNSNAYRALVLIRDVKAELTDSMSGVDYKNAMKEFNRSPRWFVYLGINGEKRLIDKIRNVIKKGGKDRLGTEMSRHMNLDSIVTL